jgi:uncharacterized membrane protein
MQNMTGGKSALGLDGNVTTAIGYLIGLVALVLIFIEKDNKFVRFHAIQSVLYQVGLGVILTVVGIVVGILMLVVGMASGGLATIVGILAILIFSVFGLIWFVGMIYGAYKSYQGTEFKFPIIGDLADKWNK